MIEEIRAFHSGMLFRYQIQIPYPTDAEAQERDAWLRDQVGSGVKRWTASRDATQPLSKALYMRFRYHQDAMAYLLRWGYRK